MKCIDWQSANGLIRKYKPEKALAGIAEEVNTKATIYMDGERYYADDCGCFLSEHGTPTVWLVMKGDTLSAPCFVEVDEGDIPVAASSIPWYGHEYEEGLDD